MSRVDLPAGGWADLVDPAALTAEQRFGLLQKLAAAKGRGTDTYDDAEIVLAHLLTGWSFDVPLPDPDGDPNSDGWPFDGLPAKVLDALEIPATRVVEALSETVTADDAAAVQALVNALLDAVQQGAEGRHPVRLDLGDRFLHAGHYAGAAVALGTAAAGVVSAAWDMQPAAAVEQLREFTATALAQPAAWPTIQGGVGRGGLYVVRPQPEE